MLTILIAGCLGVNTLSPTENSNRPVRDTAAVGHWCADHSPSTDLQSWQTAIKNIKRPIFVILTDQGLAVSQSGQAEISDQNSTQLSDRISDAHTYPLIAHASAIHPAQLGDHCFCEDHGIRYAYMTGAMANGIASTQLVQSVANAHLLGSFGAAGLRIETIAKAIDYLQTHLSGNPFCVNLIHSPNEPAHEEAVVDLLLNRGVNLIEASAYLDLTLAVVRYRVTGIYQDDSGQIVTPNRIIAKASRIEVATKWFSPPPQRFLDELIQQGAITPSQAKLSQQIPMAQDLTAEADSGGHTDNRPLVTLLPTMIALRSQLQQQYQYQQPLRVGAAGGISTPQSALAAFAMGAAYIVTGSINQACVESGSSDAVRQMLAETRQADITMAPAADMFEMGVKLQVLKRGTMFPMRANKLYELYRNYASLEDIPQATQAELEKQLFKKSLTDIWHDTVKFFTQFDPQQVHRAQNDPKHKMALVFRWYLGLSSRWANAGEASRRIDYQVWCGPAMGAFNQWVKNSELEVAENRTVAEVAYNLLYCTAVLTRINQLRSQGARIADSLTHVPPINRNLLKQWMQ